MLKCEHCNTMCEADLEVHKYAICPRCVIEFGYNLGKYLSGKIARIVATEETWQLLTNS